jgi:pseudouridylate synthase
MTLPIDIRPEVAEALAEGGAVLALESTAIAHGLPWPDNLETAHRLTAAARAGGAVPAVIGVLDGRVRVGVDDAGLERFARGAAMPKVSRRDLAIVTARGGDGATTVAGTMLCAALAGIAVFATGGIGGVHRGAAETFDVSADLTELARTPVAVVCSGAKSILDLPKTLEALETLGVPVLGWRTGTFPAFHARSSGLAVDARVDGAEEVARVIRAQRRLGRGGVVIASPVPEAAALDGAAVEAWIGEALREAEAARIRGKAITPFLLQRLAELSGGATLAANVALLESNARVGAEIAAALAAG